MSVGCSLASCKRIAGFGVRTLGANGIVTG
jgi:hypothetical protein